MPAGECCLVVKLILAVPAENHVAKIESGLQRREELVPRDVFAADHTVEIDHPKLDMGQSTRFHQRFRVPGGFDVSGIHVDSVLVGQWAHQ